MAAFSMSEGRKFGGCDDIVYVCAASSVVLGESSRLTLWTEEKSFFFRGKLSRSLSNRVRRF
jgi:hypothetical protein